MSRNHEQGYPELKRRTREIRGLNEAQVPFWRRFRKSAPPVTAQEEKDFTEVVGQYHERRPGDSQATVPQDIGLTPESETLNPSDPTI